MQGEENHPQKLTMDKGLEFIEINKDEDNWFLQIEEFDPHEPFFAPERFREMYPDDYQGPHFDWPNYVPVTGGCRRYRQSGLTDDLHKNYFCRSYQAFFEHAYPILIQL